MRYWLARYTPRPYSEIITQSYTAKRVRPLNTDNNEHAMFRAPHATVTGEYIWFSDKKMSTLATPKNSQNY